MATKKTSFTTEEFLTRVNAGEEKSIEEWAEELFPDSKWGTTRVYSALNHLRVRGNMVFPVPLNGKDQPGIVKNVTKDATWFPYVFNRHAVMTTEGAVVRSAQYAEVLIENHPKMRDDVVKIYKAIVNRATEANKKLLDIPYARTVPRK